MRAVGVTAEFAQARIRHRGELRSETLCIALVTLSCTFCVAECADPLMLICFQNDLRVGWSSMKWSDEVRAQRSAGAQARSCAHAGAGLNADSTERATASIDTVFAHTASTAASQSK